MAMTLPKVIGHRGSKATAPENTCASFARAADDGAKWIEFDVMLSKDGHPMVIHDDAVDRTVDGTGLVNDMTKAELQKLDAGVKFGAQFQGEKIPTLQETLDLAKKRGLNVNMEIKPSGGRDVETATVAMNTLKQHWPDHKDKVLVSSFSREALATAKKVAPEIPRGFLMEEIDADWKDAAKKLGATSINCNQKDLNPPLVQEMKKEGYKVTAWTVNTPKRATELWNMKVDSIFTDAPGQMLMVQKKWAADKLKSSGLVATAAANASSKGVSR